MFTSDREQFPVTVGISSARHGLLLELSGEDTAALVIARATAAPTKS